ncbi:MAG: transcription termination/antitermination NusG family protein, partial [Atopobiaceae bacterium]|nr:transcription termination/antitermination NusG family protein [Atopobiaceae bacterium]
MAESGWYVAQVQTGREQAMCTVIERACQGATTHDGSPLLEECFSPTYIHRLKYNGEWCDVEKRLLPGYVVVVTSSPVSLFHRLKRIREFARLLTMAETFVPLNEAERAWMDENTTTDNRVIPISFGYRKGDALVVVDGPLKNHEGMITRVVRKKCLAIVEIHAGSVRIVTEVGLA